LGAVEVIPKPGAGYTAPDLNRVVHAVRAAAAARGRIGKHREFQCPQASTTLGSEFRLETTHKVIAIGASTGGTKAIEAVLKGMPPNAPGTVIVQHMPEHFTAAFAKRLDSLCQVQVREACDGDAVVPGIALIAPGNKHMTLVQSGAKYLVRLNDSAPVNFQR